MQIPMNRTHLEASSEDAEFLRLRQVGKDAPVRLSVTALDVEQWPGRISLFAISNRFGYYAAGRNDSFVVAPIHSLRRAFDPDASPYFPQYISPLSSPPVFIKFTCEGERLIVATRDGRVHIYATPTNPQAWSSTPPAGNPPALASLHTFSHSDIPIRDVQPNPSDRPDVVALLRGAKGTPSLVEILDVKAFQVFGSIPGDAQSGYQTALSWSPKGKQISVGLRNGQLVQYGADGIQKSTVPQPDPSRLQEVVSVLWIEGTVFLAVYGNPEMEHEYSSHIIIHDSKTSQTTDIALEDPTPPFGLTTRESARSYIQLKDWQPTQYLLFATDAPADDIGVIGYLTRDNPRWVKFDLDDTARGSVPLAEDGSASFLVGFDVDLTSTTPISTSTQFGDDSPPLPAAPILFGYTAEGLVIAYHILNSVNPAYPGMQPFTNPPSSSNNASNKPADPQTPPPVTSVFGASTTTPTSVFGSTSPFGASTTPKATFGGTSFGQSPFGSASFSQTPAFGQSSFGAPSSTTPVVSPTQPTPAFGQTSVFGATSTPAFGQSAFGASTTKPAFGQLGFGSNPPSNFGASAAGTGFASFGAKAPAFGTSGFGVSGFGVAAKPATSAFGSTGFGSFATASSSAQSAFSSVAKPTVVAPGTGAFGSFASGPSIFGTTASASKPTDTPTTAKPGDAQPSPKPVFGAPTAFGSTGFGSFAAPKSTTPTPPIKVAAGSAFGGFAASSTSGGFGAFAPKSQASGSFADLLSSGDTKLPPMVPLEPPPGTAKGPSISAASKIPHIIVPRATGLRGATQDTEEDEEQEGEMKERFPEADAEAKEPTKFNRELFETPESLKPPPATGSTTSRFSQMSYETAKPPTTTSSSPFGFNMMNLSTPLPPPSAAVSAFSGYPMSTTSDLEQQPSDSATEVNRTPGREDQRRPEGEETPSDEGSDEGEREVDNESDQEEQQGQGGDDGDYLSVSLSPVEEEREVDEVEDDDTMHGRDGSYIMAQPPTPPVEGSTTTPRGTPNRPSPEGSTTPEGSPEKPTQSAKDARRSTSPTGRSPSPLGLNIPPSTSQPALPRHLGGRSPFSSAPIISSPLAAPPISGTSPSKPGGQPDDREGDAVGLPRRPEVEESPSDRGRRVAKDRSPDDSDVEETPSKPAAPVQKPVPQAPMTLPLPSEDDEDKKARTRTKTPPLAFGLFGSGSRPKSLPNTTSTTPTPPAGLFASASNATPSNIFAPQPSQPEVSPLKPVFGNPSFSFGAPKHPTSVTPPAPLTTTGTLPPQNAFSNAFGGSTMGFGRPQPPQNPVVPRSTTPAQTSELKAPAGPAAPEPPANPLEQQFKKVISEISCDIAEITRAVVDQKRAQSNLLARTNAGLCTRRDLDSPDQWSFSDLKHVRSVTLSFQDEVDVIEAAIAEMKKQIALMQSLALKVETRQAEILRYSQGRDDPEVVSMIKERDLGPEQEENQTRLRHLHQTISERVEQLERFVEDEKKKVDRAKAGKVSMQTPTLQSIYRAMQHIQAAATTRLDEIRALEDRMVGLGLEDPSRANNGDVVPTDATNTPANYTSLLTPSRATSMLSAATPQTAASLFTPTFTSTPQLSSSSLLLSGMGESSYASSSRNVQRSYSNLSINGGGSLVSTGRRSSRTPVDLEVRAAAAAALNAERSAARLKAVLLEARGSTNADSSSGASTVTAPWNRSVIESAEGRQSTGGSRQQPSLVNPDVVARLHRTAKATRVLEPIPAWAKPDHHSMNRRNSAADGPLSSELATGGRRGSQGGVGLSGSALLTPPTLTRVLGPNLGARGRGSTTSPASPQPPPRTDENGYIPPGARGQNDVPSFSFDNVAEGGGAGGRNPLPGRPLASASSINGLNGGGTPPKIKPMPKLGKKKGFGMNFDAADD